MPCRSRARPREGRSRERKAKTTQDDPTDVFGVVCFATATHLRLYEFTGCVYRKTKPARNGDEARVYIKPRSPQLNGKVERSHRSDQEEFYQLLSYKDDVDLEAKLADWKRFYNLARPHGAHNGKTPYEALRDRL